MRRQEDHADGMLPNMLLYGSRLLTKVFTSSPNRKEFVPSVETCTTPKHTRNEEARRQINVSMTNDIRIYD